MPSRVLDRAGHRMCASSRRLQPLPDREDRIREGGGRLLREVVTRIDHAVLVAAGEHVGLVCRAAGLKRVARSVQVTAGTLILSRRASRSSSSSHAGSPAARPKAWR